MNRNRVGLFSPLVLCCAVLAGPLAQSATDAGGAVVAMDTRDYVLEVASEHGTPQPATGRHLFCWRSTVICTADAEAVEGGTTYTNNGWTGTGSIPESGTSANTAAVPLADIRSSIAWQWEAQPVSHSVRLRPGPHGAIAEADGGGSYSETVADGAGCPRVRVTPADGYRFAGWMPALPDTVTADFEATAVYTPKEYALTYAAFEHGTVRGDSPQVVPHGEAGTEVTAVPEQGYHFVQWSDGVSTPTRSEINVADDVEAIALFALVAHTVTFLPGERGQWPENASCIEIDVPHGYVRPDAPRPVVMHDDWRHVGWEWQSDEGVEAPTVILRDWTATALYEYQGAEGEWMRELTVRGEHAAVLQFGMREGASGDWDPEFDEQSSFPGKGQARLVSPDFGRAYAADYRDIADAADFLLLASADERAPLTIAWDAAFLPEGTFITLCEVVPDIVATPRPLTKAAFVGDTARSMESPGSIVVPAQETRCFLLRYAREVMYDLPLVSGWNMVSLPVEPTNPDVEAVFPSEAGDRRGAASLDDQNRGTIRSGAVWTWRSRGYAVANEIRACTGYWVYSAEDCVRVISGTPVERAEWDLANGWNQCGVGVPCRVPEAPCIDGVVWQWDGRADGYCPAAALRRGLGYWVHASTNGKVPLTQR